MMLEILELGRSEDYKEVFNKYCENIIMKNFDTMGILYPQLDIELILDTSNESVINKIQAVYPDKIVWSLPAFIQEIYIIIRGLKNKNVYINEEKFSDVVTIMLAHECAHLLDSERKKYAENERNFYIKALKALMSSDKEDLRMLKERSKRFKKADVKSEERAWRILNDINNDKKVIDKYLLNKIKEVSLETYNGVQWDDFLVEKYPELLDIVKNPHIQEDYKISIRDIIANYNKEFVIG